MSVFHRIFPLLLLLPGAAAADLPILAHDLHMSIDEGTRSFTARDRIVAADTGTGDIPDLPDLSLTPDFRISSLAFDGRPVDTRGLGAQINVPKGTARVDVTYEGDVDDSQWPSIVWLPGDGWYPEAADHRVRFKLTLALPQGWAGLTQGVPGETGPEWTWAQEDPQRGIYLATGPWHVRSKQAGGYRAGVMLIDRDDELSDAYLDAALEHLGRYSEAIGDYPYDGFTLVENRRPTGWGMPGFTLLGSEIIRLPFIIHTSFPHEVLHNWWGNGVFATRDGGNWSEGLTTYLSDYLARERRGEGRQYRLNALIAWHDYALSGADFPLSRFEGRHDRATQAVGYGKGMFLFHMLRREVGDTTFLAGLRDLYTHFKFRYASFSDIRQTFERACDCGLDRFFSQWLDRRGAPTLQLDAAIRSADGDRHSLTARISQSGLDNWNLQVPVRVVDTRGNTTSQMIRLEGESASAEFALEFPAARVDVDPEIELFRMLDEGEKPVTFSKLFSAEHVAIPAGAVPLRKTGSELAKRNSGWSVLPDGAGIPPRANVILLLGWEHPLARQWFGSRPSEKYRVRDEGVEVDGVLYAVDEKQVVAIIDTLDIEGESRTVLWLATGAESGLPELMRRLSHYGRFSYAVFESPEARAMATGQWRAQAGTLSHVFDPGAPVKSVPQPPALF